MSEPGLDQVDYGAPQCALRRRKILVPERCPVCNMIALLRMHGTNCWYRVECSRDYTHGPQETWRFATVAVTEWNKWVETIKDERKHNE